MNVRRAVLALAVGVSALASSPPAEAHRGALVELFVSRLRLEPAPGGVWTVHVSVIDADSGTPQPGFEVVATGSGDGGSAVAGPVMLSDLGDGAYGGRVPVTPGRWHIDVHAQTLPGGTPAVPLTRSFEVTLEEGRTVTVGGRAGGGGAGPDSARLAVAGVTTAGVLLALLTIGRHRRPLIAPAGD